jgi:hypothetical protein
MDEHVLFSDADFERKLAKPYHLIDAGNRSSVCSVKRRNASRLRPYRNIVNEEMPDPVYTFPLLEWIPETRARAKKSEAVTTTSTSLATVRSTPRRWPPPQGLRKATELAKGEIPMWPECITKVI